MKPHRILPVLVVAILAAYSNSLRNGFIGDDHIYVESNAFVHNTSNLRLMTHPSFYLEAHEILSGNRPVFLMSLLLDHAFWGDHPAGYHATNLLLHVANSIGVFALASALGLSGIAPFIAGLFFGLHPIVTEAVNGVSSRPDLLAAFFVLISLWLYLQSRTRVRPKAALCILGSVFAFALALLSKEMAITLPLLILFVEYYYPAAEDRSFRFALLLPALLVVGAAWAGFWTERFSYQGLQGSSMFGAALQRVASAMPTVPGPASEMVAGRIEKAHLFSSSSWEWSALYADRGAWFRTSARTLATYLRLMIVPAPLVADRAPISARSWLGLDTLFSFAALFLAAWYAAAFRRKDSGSAFGVAWCLVAMIPVSNLIPLYNPAAERYLYLPAAGAALAAGSAFEWLRRRKPELRWIPLAAGLWLAAFGIRTWLRNLDWRNERTLFLNSATASEPQNSRVLLVRAALLQQDGRVADAVREYETAIDRRPDFAEGWLGLGSAYAASGNVAKADAALHKAVDLSPKNPSMYFTYGLFLAGAGQPARAVEMYRQSLRLEPEFVEAWVNLGALYRDEGKFLEARDCYEKALVLAPPHDPMPAYSFATMLEKSGDKAGAVKQYQAALDRDPAFDPARARLAKLQSLTPVR